MLHEGDDYPPGYRAAEKQQIETSPLNFFKFTKDCSAFDRKQFSDLSSDTTKASFLNPDFTSSPLKE